MKVKRVRIRNLNGLAQLAAEIQSNLRPGDVIFLSGPLGAGKTTFAQKLFSLYGVPETDVTSPTFSLIERYEVHGRNKMGPQKTLFPGAKELVHADCYRLPGNDEAILAELTEVASTAELLVIEWPEKMPNLAERFSAWQIDLQELPDGTREATVKPPEVPTS